MLVAGGVLLQRHGRRSPKDFERLAAPHSGVSGDCFWILQDFPAEMTFPNGFRSVLAGRITGCDARFETVEGKQGLGPRAFVDRLERLLRRVLKPQKRGPKPWAKRPGMSRTGRSSN